MTKTKRATVIPKRKSYYVAHPRYGSLPCFTGLDVDKAAPGVYFRAWTEGELDSWKNHPFWRGHNIALSGFLIPATAIVADPSKQHGSAMLNTHYYDIERKCCDCGRLFIFYAQEQRHWYEELRFPVDADCVRCYTCRRVTQDVDRAVREYEVLIALPEPSDDQIAELAVLRLVLVQAGRFHTRQLEQVRAFLNRFPHHPKANEVRCRLATITSEAQEHSA
jgi:hypothetical protein